MGSMAARTIVTSHPDVACDVCGRRLLRGERPDVFLGGGQRRMVCELCTPRAAHEGWRRETEEPGASPRERRSERGRSLLGRLRQLREPARPARAARDAATADGERLGEEEWSRVEAQWGGVGEDWIAAGAAVDGEPRTPGPGPGAERAAAATGLPGEDVTPATPDAGGAGEVWASADLGRALEVFNAGEHPRRVAGVTRALGPACVKAIPVAGSSGTVAIVVAWELCWYRYEIDLTDEAAGVRLVAEGMELEELPADDRVANTAADERGELSLLEA
jgi:hypothetical protein